MIYTKTDLQGAFIIDVQKIEDERGFFAYGFDAEEARGHGVDLNIVQAKISFNHVKGNGAGNALAGGAGAGGQVDPVHAGERSMM